MALDVKDKEANLTNYLLSNNPFFFSAQEQQSVLLKNAIIFDCFSDTFHLTFH